MYVTITINTCRGPNASNPARGRTLPGQERPSNGRPDAYPKASGVHVVSGRFAWCPICWYPSTTTVLTYLCTNHSAPYIRYPPGGGVLLMWWVIHMCRGFDPLFSLWQDRARYFWGIFSHPPTPKRSFGVLKLPILTEFDLLGPKFHFSLDLFGSNFQRPAAHPHHFSDRVPPPPGIPMLPTDNGGQNNFEWNWKAKLALIWLFQWRKSVFACEILLSYSEEQLLCTILCTVLAYFNLLFLLKKYTNSNTDRGRRSPHPAVM